MLISLRDEYESYEHKEEVTYTEFREEVMELIHKMQDLVVEGDIVKLPFSSFRIKLKVNDFAARPLVNFPVTNANRKKILEKGGTPLEVYKDKDGNITGDNGGEPYIQYLMDDTYYWIVIGSDRKLQVGENKYKYIPFKRIKRAKSAMLVSKPSIRNIYAAN